MLGARTRVAALAAAGLSVGLLAAVGVAAPGDDPPSAPDDVVVEAEEETPTTGAADLEAPDDAGVTASAGTERYWGPECGEGEPTNHGLYVAGAERNGEARSTAAQSPCGKPLSSLSETDDELEPEDEGEPVGGIEVAGKPAPEDDQTDDTVGVSSDPKATGAPAASAGQGKGKK